jgi:hypothetical protein
MVGHVIPDRDGEEFADGSFLNSIDAKSNVPDF